MLSIVNTGEARSYCHDGPSNEMNFTMSVRNRARSPGS
jgi:hypothetical protein